MNKRQPGFQLIEVIIAGLIFFLVSFFVLNLLPTSQWAVVKAETKMTAESLAYSTLETLRSGSFDNLTMGPHPPVSSTENGTSFETSFEVSGVAGSNDDLLRDVVVTVTWTEREVTRQVTARSYIGRIRR